MQIGRKVALVIVELGRMASNVASDMDIILAERRLFSGVVCPHESCCLLSVALCNCTLKCDDRWQRPMASIKVTGADGLPRNQGTISFCWLYAFN